MSTQLEETVRKCPVCVKFQVPRAESLLSSELPSLPWQVGTDLFEWKKSHYLLVINYYSRWIEISRLPQMTSRSTVNHLSSIFARYGIPGLVISDNGPQYSSECFKEFASNYEAPTNDVQKQCQPLVVNIRSIWHSRARYVRQWTSVLIGVLQGVCQQLRVSTRNKQSPIPTGERRGREGSTDHKGSVKESRRSLPSAAGVYTPTPSELLMYHCMYCVLGYDWLCNHYYLWLRLVM